VLTELPVKLINGLARTKSEPDLRADRTTSYPVSFFRVRSREWKLICCQSAGAVPANPAAVKEAATAASAVEQTHYIHHGRYGFAKCYRDLVFGPYRCHRFPL
jgi:hypothetical protein